MSTALTAEWERRAKVEAARLVGARIESDPKPEFHQGNCSVCGRFLRKNGLCPVAFYDDWTGGWEHD